MENNTKYMTLLERKKLIDDFLYIPDEFKEYISNKNKFWVYVIAYKDNIDKPLYIGKTTNLRRRASQYYMFTTRENKDKIQDKRKIQSLINLKGFEKFTMYPIFITDDEDEICEKEIFYIKKFDLIENGYNVSLQSSKSNMKIDNHFIHSYHTAKGKRIKSKPFFIININTKKAYIVTGLKLAGELMGGISKDNVKTAAKRGIPRSGYFMYYLTYIDFEFVLNEVKRKLEKGIFYGPKNSSNIVNYKLSYELFIKYAKYIKNYLKTKENPEDFDIKFVTQNDNEIGYDIIEPDEFINDYSHNIMKIYNGDPEF